MLAHAHDPRAGEAKPEDPWLSVSQPGLLGEFQVGVKENKKKELDGD